MHLLKNKEISVGARSSNLSQAQVWEVYQALIAHHPSLMFFPQFVSTTGDLDHQTSLRYLDKTNFFTKEIDSLLIDGQVDIAIHSAKDLPDPLPEGLQLLALTRGLTAQDVIVGKQFPLPYGARVGTSSLRREKNLHDFRSDIVCVDIRGTIEQRLALLDTKELDGVIIAEAALIRLNLTHYNRIVLPGESAALQGQLAIIGRACDESLVQLFACLDSRSNRCSTDRKSFQ
jgi:hydroxymethylbilane synthase